LKMILEVVGRQLLYIVNWWLLTVDLP